MHYRRLGRTGWNISEISFGAWAIGGSWGEVDDDQSLAALNQAVDCGVNFIDTADVYGIGRSERLLARLKRDRGNEIIIATKAGRKLAAQTPAGYTRENLELWVDESLRNLETGALDLLQLHCPSTDVYYRPEIFGLLDDLVKAGKVRHYGVSVERVEEALKAIEYPNVATIQIIFNCFRRRPAGVLFEQTHKRNVGVIARVPLASGLLTGKFDKHSQFAAEDHRHFNRNGDAFDVGETFSGVDFNTALEALEEIRRIVPQGMTMAQFALKWILMFEAVSCAIPGGKSPEQVSDNCRATDLPKLSAEMMSAVERVYRQKIAPSVHQRW